MPLSPALPPHLPAPPTHLAQRLAALAADARAGRPAARAELGKACQMLEAHFVAWLLREMRQTVPDGGLFPRGPTEETYEQLFDDALAKAVAQGGGIGLARSLEAQLAPRLAGPAADPAGRTPPSPSRTPAESR